MTPAGRPIEVLLIEDDPGDVLITREALRNTTRFTTFCMLHATARKVSTISTNVDLTRARHGRI